MTAIHRYTTRDALVRQPDVTYDYAAGNLGIFKVRHLRHGEIRRLSEKYVTAEKRIEPFDAFLDEMICLAVVEPPLTQDDLDAILDQDEALKRLGLHIGRTCNILATPPHEGK